MRRIGRLLPVVLAASACSAQPLTGISSPADQACFWPSEVSGFSDAGADRALVRIGTREVWELTLSPGCPDMDWALKIGIKGRSGERICTGRPAELIVPEASGSGSRRCLVRTVRRLSSEEAATALGTSPTP